MARKKAARRTGKTGKGSGGWFRGNIIAGMVLKLLVALLLMFLSRILFFLLNYGYFSSLGFQEALKIFFVGLRFDISAILLLNLPFILMLSLPFRFRMNRWYLGIANTYFYVINAFGLMLNFIDLIYFRFTLKRTTADIFSYLSVGGDFDKLVPQFLRDFWYVLIIWIAFIAILVWLGSRFRTQAGKSKDGGIKYLLVHTFLFLVIGFLTVIGIRGGFQLRPISILTAGNYTSAKYVPLLLNTPFAIARTWNDEQLKTITFFKREADLARVFNPVHKGSTKGFTPMNVMIIILESFSREHIGSLNRYLENGHYQGFTPFLDSLIREGYYFNAYANGKTSIQGVPAILSSIPSLMNESFIQSRYATARYTSIAGLLKNKGYTTAFFHGGTNGTMGFDSYTRMVGYDRYFGRSEYNNEKDYDGNWGIMDEEFFQYTAKELNGLKQPFVGTLFTLSSHHPYFVPGRYRNVMRKGKLPIQQSIMYTDHALSEFFKTVRHMPWYRNTLFVLTADHTSEGYYPFYQTNVGQLAIPLLFFKPGGELKGFSDLTAQQTDVMPTVLNYLGYDQDYLAFGADLFDSTAAHFSVQYTSGLYGLVKDSLYLEFNGSEGTSLFNLGNDLLQKKNIIKTDLNDRKKLEHFMKAYIQQYNNRVIENRLIIDN